MNVEDNFTAHNEYFRFLRAKLDEANALNEISDNVAALKPAEHTEVSGKVATQPGEGWDAIFKPLACHLERIATALEQRGDSPPVPAETPTWPDQASGGALYALRLTAHLRLRLFDARANDPKSGISLADEISEHLKHMPKDDSLVPMFVEVGKLMAGQDELKKSFDALFTPLADTPLREAVSQRLCELAKVECHLVKALADQAWPVSPDPFDESATRTVRANAKK